MNIFGTRKLHIKIDGMWVVVVFFFFSFQEMHLTFTQCNMSSHVGIFSEARLSFHIMNSSSCLDRLHFH